MNGGNAKGDRAWHEDWRVRWLAFACLVAGFLIGLLVFFRPWRLPWNLGDLPTWILVLLAAIAGWAGFNQLGLLRTQVKVATDETDARARAERRKQAEDVQIRFHSQDSTVVAFVINGSRRPVTDLTCKFMSKDKRVVLAEPSSSAPADYVPVTPAPGSPAELTHGAWAAKPRYETLRPHEIRAFLFSPAPTDPDRVIVAWFTDDASYRWQLDEYMHLAERSDEDNYLP